MHLGLQQLKLFEVIWDRVLLGKYNKAKLMTGAKRGLKISTRRIVHIPVEYNEQQMGEAKWEYYTEIIR